MTPAKYDSRQGDQSDLVELGLKEVVAFHIHDPQLFASPDGNQFLRKRSNPVELGLKDIVALQIDESTLSILHYGSESSLIRPLPINYAELGLKVELGLKDVVALPIHEAPSSVPLSVKILEIHDVVALLVHDPPLSTGQPRQPPL